MESISSWSKRSKCRQEGLYQENITKKYCTGCEVMGLCNTYAIVHRERGVWGGTTEAERLRVDSFNVDILRNLYQSHGLLENRSTDPLESLGQLVELQQADTDPNVDPGGGEDSNLSQSA